MEKQNVKNYRQMFEQAGTRKAKVKNAKLLDETIIKDRTTGTPKYTTHQISGLLSCKPVAMDQKEGVAAFIIEDQFSVGGHGVRYSIDFGVIKGKKICRHGLFTVRGGTASESDDFKRWYKTVRILEVDGSNVTIGLGSNGVIDIYKVNVNSGDFNRSERHDLDGEREQKENAALAVQINGEKSLKNLTELWEKKLGKEAGELTSVSSKIFEKEGLALFESSHYDRRYDAAVDSITFHALREGWKEPKLIKKLDLEYDQSIRDGEKYYVVEARTEYSDPMQEGKRTIIPVGIRVVFQVGGGGWIGMNSWSKTLKEMKVKLAIGERGD